ncbi:MAG: peptidase P60, partial [Pseudomonadota bacterium]
MDQPDVRPHTAGDVVRVARTWIGTPYHHQASCRLIGTDCLGLVRGVWRELYGADGEAPPAYANDWAEATGRETLLNAAHRHLIRQQGQEISGGDVVVFRYRRGMVAKHVGIATG